MTISVLKGSKVTDVTRLLVIANVLVYLAMLAGSFSWRQLFIFRTDTLLNWGANLGAFTVNGQYWRVFTSMFVQAGIIHLALNMYALIIFGPTVCSIYGPWRFLLIYLLSGLSGAFARIIWNPAEISAGASAALMGMIGALFAYVVSKGDTDRAAQFAHPLVFFGLICASIVGGLLVPEIDNAAHIGGLFGGFVTGLLLLPPVKGDKYKIPIVFSLSALSVITVLAFTFAVHAARADKRTGAYRIAAAAEEHLKARNYKEAYKDFDSLLKTDLTSTYFVGRANALIGLKDYGKALDDCNKALALDPKYIFAYLTRANVFHKTGKFEKSIADLSVVIERAPNQSAAYNSRAWTEIALGKYDSSLEDANRALKIDPESAEALDTRGLVYLCLNDYHKSMLDFERGLLIKPEEGACHYHLALLYEKCKQPEKAETEYLKAKNLNYEPEAWEAKLKKPSPLQLEMK